MTSFRFQVAFSFAGPNREKVRAIAEKVRTAVGDGLVFFDEWFEPELLGEDMELLLQRFYHEQSLMVVADVSDVYSNRQWCQAEARAIRALRFKIDSARDEVGRLRLLNARFGPGGVPGLFDTSGSLDGINKNAEQCAEIILRRLALLRERLESPMAATSVSDGRPSDRSHLPPANLHYLCDRGDQEKALGLFFSKATIETFRRPIIVLVHGDSREAHSIFVERMCESYLPGRLKQLGISGTIEDVKSHLPLRSLDSAALSVEVRQQIAAGLGVETAFESDEKLVECFGKTGARVIAPVFDFSNREGFAGKISYIEMLMEYWSKFPNLPPERPVISFICVKYLEPESSGLFSRISASLKSDSRKRLRRIIMKLGTDAQHPKGIKLIHVVLPELKPVLVEDVARWFQSPSVRPHVRRRLLFDAIHRQIFNSRLDMPMEPVLEELEKFIHAES